MCSTAGWCFFGRACSVCECFAGLPFSTIPLFGVSTRRPNYYQNDTGSQNKPTLAVQGTVVPVVEGKSAANSRWTACLSC